jgi:Fe-S-cluster containining protein
VKCEKCGSCCLQLKGIINVSDEDIKRWVNENRADILQYCYGWRGLNDAKEEVVRHLTKGVNMEMWFDAERDEIDLCPFLRKKYGKNEFECTIHETKPEVCRNYICNPKDMSGIIKKPFKENLEEYRKKRR